MAKSRNRKLQDVVVDGEDEDISCKLDKIICSIADMKKDIRAIHDIEKSITYMSDEIIDLKKELREVKTDLRREHAEKNTMKEKLERQNKEIDDLKANVESLLVKEKAALAEVKGIPKKEGEALKDIIISVAKAAGLQLKAADIKDVYRNRAMMGKLDLITVIFHDENVRNDFIVKCRKARLTLHAIKYDGSESIYVNESLTWYTRKLFNAAQIFKKKEQYQFCWIKNGKVFLRKEQGSKIFSVRNEGDLVNIQYFLVTFLLLLPS